MIEKINQLRPAVTGRFNVQEYLIKIIFYSIYHRGTAFAQFNYFQNVVCPIDKTAQKLFGKWFFVCNDGMMVRINLFITSTA